jgi:hypothetical protein
LSSRRKPLKSFAAITGCAPALLAVLSLFVSMAWGQQDAGTSSGAAPAATGTAERDVENPPVTGLDAPSSEPVFGGRSYLVPGLQLSESVASNAYGSAGNGSGTGGVTHALGSLDLQKVSKKSQFGLDYIAGGDFYEGANSSGSHAYQVHTLGADERILWRSGQLAIRDSFDYLPEGTFGFDSFGGAGGFAPALGGSGITGIGSGSGLGGGLTGGTPAGLFGGGQYGSLGFEPRIDNLSIVDITQAFSARTSVTLGGGFDVTHYLDKSRSLVNAVNSEQTTGQVGYNYLLNKRDQIGVTYAFQEFHFPQAFGAGSVNTHIWNLLYARRISGRLNLVLGGGPQLLYIHTPEIPLGTFLGLQIALPAQTTKVISGNGNVSLGYTVSARTAVQVSYMHYITGGSGFFAGAKTDAARASVSHLFARYWTTSTDVGYSRNSNLHSSAAPTGVNSQAYKYWYGGTSIRRQLGRYLGVFASYQYDHFGFSGCASSGSLCGQSANGHIGTIGIDWHPNPLRLD